MNEDAIRGILDLARWAPSGDNTQPWRFEIAGPDRVAVHARDTRDHCVYDLDGHASQLAHGALVETIRIAASKPGLGIECTRRVGAPDHAPVFDIHFVPGPVPTDPLADHILARAVHRRPLSTRALTAAERAALEGSLPPGFEVAWFEGLSRRASMAWLAFRSAWIRLSIPEAWRVHREVIQWGARFSEDRIPDEALGADAATLRLMRWAMASWERIAFLNRFLAGTLGPRIQLDLLPGLLCGAHFALLGPKEPVEPADQFAAGAAAQRLWLTATSLGLQLQPQYTPLVFARFARRGVRFTEVAAAYPRAREVAARLERLLGKDAAVRTVFLGRIGAGAPARARSTRLPLDALLVRPGAG